jgi:hypothetical protein
VRTTAVEPDTICKLYGWPETFVRGRPGTGATISALDPKTRDDLRRALSRHDADRDAIAMRLTQYRDQNGQELGRHHRLPDDPSRYSTEREDLGTGMFQALPTYEPFEWPMIDVPAAPACRDRRDGGGTSSTIR